MICIHHNDLDGRCSAAIVKKWFDGLESSRRLVFLEMDYKDKVDYIQWNSKFEDVIIVDFSLKPDDMAELRGRSGSVVWIDHHATAKDYPYQELPGLRDFNDKTLSGCELTWMHLFPRNSLPLSVRLIGDYDKWALIMPDSKTFYEGMKLIKNGPEDQIWDDLLNDQRIICAEIIRDGAVAMIYRDNYCSGLCKSFGYETEISGHKAYACNMFMFGSGGFGEKFHEYPLCIAYIHDGKQFTVSLYSETVDVGQIAKNHGGGGHKGAAGFVCETLPWEVQDANMV